MARSHYLGTVYVDLGGATGVRPLPGATVAVLDATTGAPFPYALYPSATSTSPYPLPIKSDDQGDIELWADAPARVSLVITHPLYQGDGGVVDIEPDPGGQATDAEVAQSIAAHESKSDPHPQYLLEVEGDLRYLPLAWAQQADPLPQYLTQARGDARYLTLTGAAAYQPLAAKGQPNGYAGLDASGLLPPAYLPPLAITDTYVVASQAEMLALNAQRGDVAIRLDEQKTYILAAEPASTLTNWKEMVSSQGTMNVSVVRDEEFAPSPGATTVTLAAIPTDVHQVTRNGVAQSQAAGNWSISGLVITFTDAFAAGERVGVVYSVGTSQVVDSYTQAQADAKFVDVAGDTMTGDLVRNGPDLSNRLLKWQTNGADRWRLGIIDTQAEGTPDTGGDFKFQALWNNGTAVDIFGVDRDVGKLTLFAPYQPVIVQGNNGLLVQADATGADRWEISTYRIRSYTTGGANPPLELDATGGGITMRASGSASSIATLSANTNGSLRLYASGGDYSPTTTNVTDLGTTFLRWKKLWATDADFTNAPVVGGSALQTQTAADARYLTQANASTTYLPLAGGTLTGNLLFSTDNTRDIGASGATRPRDLWLGRNLSVSGTTQFSNSLGVGVTPATNAGIATGATWLTGTTQYGTLSQPVFSSSATTLGAAIAAQSGSANVAFTMAESSDFLALGPSYGASSTITSAIGFHAQNQGGSRVTNAYGVYIDAQSGAATTNIGLYNAGTTTLAGAVTLTVAANPAAAGAIRLPNTQAVNWRNAANSADVGLSFDATDRLTMTTTAANLTTTSPAAGGAGALPATPAGYLAVVINGTARKLVYY